LASLVIGDGQHLRSLRCNSEDAASMQKLRALGYM
jgi:hypothetical protein